MTFPDQVFLSPVFDGGEMGGQKNSISLFQDIKLNVYLTILYTVKWYVIVRYC